METLEKNKTITVVSTEEKHNGGYTVFKNHDEDLVKKIKAVKLDDDTFFTHRYGKGCSIDKELGDNQYLCKSPDGLEFFTIKKEEYIEYRETDLLNKINTLYPVRKYWNDNFGILKNGYERLEVYGHEQNDEKAYDALGKVGCRTHRVEVSAWRGSSLSADMSGKWGSIMFCWFNTDGNYINRDHNIDVLKYLKTEPLYGKDLLKEVVDSIPNVPYIYSKDRWFAEDFVLTLRSYPEDDSIGYNIDRSEIRASGKYGNRGEKAITLPKRNVEQHTKGDILERIMPTVKIVMEHLDTK